ncbi:hypothetical protein [Flavobacterium seoulense]|uniref:Uncharacterized protein n=1 Tax=Flavobacterium seoulense TaxID=1492738 RepID=A0A066WVM1_9FLAO|nr:hypothetical protein [Flavobacterium seoulense]KDN54715.1 hypothetical protein FEM21_22290 [Flavobacterium seoulense]
MKHKILSLFLLVFLSNLDAQNLQPTSNISSAGAVDTFNGGYTFSYVSAGSPWSGALISFGGLSNRYDCQINSDYGPDGGNHISFRTKNGDLNVWNPWHELATKEANTFIGAQHIKGNLFLDGYNVNDEIGFESQNGFHRIAFHELRFWDWQTGEVMTINNGNVGIGTTNPTSLLTVAGNINSREVKVTVDAGADFVFENSYNLPPIESVNQFVKENKHLPEIASAQEMKTDGINLGEMNIKLLQKIEELTLYLIQQNKEIETLKKENESFHNLSNRLSVLEEEFKTKN